MTMNRKLFAKGFRHGIPIGLGYLSVAFTFGMKAVADGLSPLEALLISMTNVTSAGQFAGLPLILALEWVAAHPEERERRGPELLQALFGSLSGKDLPAPPGLGA